MILSDTHGSDDLSRSSLPRADVVLHCGDLTNCSRSEELEKTLAMLRTIDAPLKLVIPGNHEFGLERGYWRWTRDRIHPCIPAQAGETSTDKDADTSASWELFQQAARCDRMFLLPQGMHTFVVPCAILGGGNGARLRLFASPLTPRIGNWGFQYDRSNPPKWSIPPMMTSNGDGPAVDVVMTHGPPMYIRDGTGLMESQGCSRLLAAVERARPRVHCFGAELVTWKREMCASGPVGPSAPTFGNLVDVERSRYSHSSQPAKMMRPHHSPPREEASCFAVDISPDGDHTVDRGAQTLFVNTAVDPCSRPSRMPWLVDMDLPVVCQEDCATAAETMSRLLL
ncbi:putative rhamnogalacturonate lyase [Podospora australis]|uniref:Rhamnogalacturonate lyase n=1 Tax=Podospora australis TaxID=1536484 RepID=A0AAN7AG81_9PEZI|nr:putative rhamnogalacturonate lyase [Podospora australis]